MLISFLLLQFWPDEEMPSFKEAITSLYNDCIPLHNRVLEVMARGLKLEVRIK